MTPIFLISIKNWSSSHRPERDEKLITKIIASCVTKITTTVSALRRQESLLIQINLGFELLYLQKMVEMFLEGNLRK